MGIAHTYCSLPLLFVFGIRLKAKIFELILRQRRANRIRIYAAATVSQRKTFFG